MTGAEEAGERVGWTPIPSWTIPPFCTAPRHLDDGPAVLAAWLVALWPVDDPGALQLHPLCRDCVETLGRDLGITVEQGQMTAPPPFPPL